jgi:hypothetical protein
MIAGDIPPGRAVRLALLAAALGLGLLSLAIAHGEPAYSLGGGSLTAEVAGLLAGRNPQPQQQPCCRDRGREHKERRSGAEACRHRRFGRPIPAANGGFNGGAARHSDGSMISPSSAGACRVETVATT